MTDKSESGWYTRWCTNRKTCGFINGTYLSEKGYPEISPGKCVMCMGETHWAKIDEIPEGYSPACNEAENRRKLESQSYKRTIDSLRYTNELLRYMVLDTKEYRKKTLSVEEAKLLQCCRICKGWNSPKLIKRGGKIATDPFDLVEYAHESCLKKV